ncbi:MAG: AmmeMemoRadiSam system protein B [Thermoleophilia bacterium]|nr:AmmeMemoRadiSam system protein B [Gaiellaceae bacterium]MDW8338634.1 AmmeMemoRadiSam system protein B [Thermoleophilia bacterium]
MTREPVAAGTFYPEDPDELRAAVDGLLEQAERRPAPVRALVAPHAGYQYSGATAAAAFALLPGVERVVLLGPSHFVPLAGLAVSGADAWRTPLGEVRVSSRLRKRALEAGALLDDEPHARDHALEVELPFLQRACPPKVEILPVAVGSCVPGDVVRLLDALEALAIVSTDLSHYLPDEFARRRDRETADAVLRREPHAIRDGDACGVFALRGLIEHALRHGWRAELLDLRTSADATGDRGHVVGYGAFAFYAGVA